MGGQCKYLLVITSLIIMVINYRESILKFRKCKPLTPYDCVETVKPNGNLTFMKGSVYFKDTSHEKAIKK